MSECLPKDFIAQQKALQAQERDTLLARVAALERAQGYGTKGKPTTSQLRHWFQHTGGYCQHCGKSCLKQDDVDVPPEV